MQAYSQYYKQRKLTWLEEVIRLEDNDPLKYTNFKPSNLGNWDVGTKIQGRPKTQWADTGKSQYSQQIQHNLDQPLKEQTWPNTPQQNESMEKTARESAIRHAAQANKSKQKRQDHMPLQPARARPGGRNHSRRLNLFGQITP